MFTLKNLARKGLIFDSGVRLAGTRNSSVMWFYSVVGLFKVVFEYLPLNVQRDCLQLKVGYVTSQFCLFLWLRPRQNGLHI